MKWIILVMKWIIPVMKWIILAMKCIIFYQNLAMEDVVEEDRLTPRFSRVLKTKLELSIQKQYKATWDGCFAQKFAP